MKISNIGETPVTLGLKDKTILKPTQGWDAHAWYIVEVAYEPNNVIHKALFYSGYLDGEGRPGGYNCLINPSYDCNPSIGKVYYLAVINKIPPEVIDIR